MRKIPMVSAALLFLLALNFSGTAFAHGVTGDSFLESCKRGKFGEGFCLGYIQGIDEKTFFNAAMKQPTAYCPNPGESTKVKLKKVIDWLEQNPASKGKPQSTAVMDALKALYPCAK